MKYRLGKLLGKGGFGKVYECVNMISLKHYAVKIVMKARMNKDAELVQLMEQELEVLQRTNHPNIVKLIDVYEDEVNFYIVSELMKGGDLYNYMLKVKRLSERKAASVIKQTLQAINYMHNQKIVHRDLKPENILLASIPDKNDSIYIKLTDFGLATRLQEGTKLK